MNYLLAVIAPIILVSCAQIDNEQARKDRVEQLVQEIYSKSPAKRDSAYLELKDIYSRKRDISYFEKEISKKPRTKSAGYLSKLAVYMKERWRLPEKGWTSEKHDLLSPYYEKAKTLGSTVIVRDNDRPRPKPAMLMEVYFPDENERSHEVEDLIMTLEPETLSLLEGWKDISFVRSLTNLQELTICDSGVDNLLPLKGMQNLSVLKLKNTKVTDLSPLREIPNLRLLYLEKDRAVNLEPLKGTSVKVILTE